MSGKLRWLSVAFVENVTDDGKRILMYGMTSKVIIISKINLSEIMS